jgi:hypothetical protein
VWRPEGSRPNSMHPTTPLRAAQPDLRAAVSDLRAAGSDLRAAGSNLQAANPLLQDVELSLPTDELSSPALKSPSKGVRVVCMCQTSGCASKTFTNEFGKAQPGRLVSSSTRSLHRRKDKSLPVVDVPSLVCLCSSYVTQ